MALPRLLLVAVLSALAVFAGFRVIAAANGAAPPGTSPDPRRLLQTAPLEGEAFAAIARAAENDAEPSTIVELHEIAARRAPRDLRARAWLAERALRAGRYSQALEQLDVILRLSPDARKALLPAMVQWSADPAFANALADRLQDEPAWRGRMLAALQAEIDTPAAGNVLAALREAGGMSEIETGRWLDALIRAGQWGQAYSHWVASLDLEPGDSLPMLFNGGFEQPPTGQGFDWRVGRAPGTYTDFQPTPGARGQAANIVFLGRPVTVANLEQALLLPPGRYRLRMRIKAQALRTDQGLYWGLECAGQPRQFATGDRIDGSFDWQEFELEFDVPVTGCPGQWLRLRNPAPGGSAKLVSGELWIDDFELSPAPPS